jgi:hypothetical protein
LITTLNKYALANGMETVMGLLGIIFKNLALAGSKK